MSETLFEGARLQMNEAIELTIASLLAYGTKSRHWAIAWSGGKDSSMVLTLVIHLILSGKVAPPASLTVLYADTRLELVPLWIAAGHIRGEIAEHAEALDAMGCKLRVEVVTAEMDRRFFVYMLGRGVPPPSNSFRWCTPGIKIEPMERALEGLAVSLGFGEMIANPRKAGRPVIYRGHGADKLLVLTGVRVGESAARDDRIALSCGRDGAECGQGWFQETLPEALCDTLAPALHWRVCHVWRWLRDHAPEEQFGGWSTRVIADAYGGDEAEEANARTGCVGCNLTSDDHSLNMICKNPRWRYLLPLKGLRRLYAELKRPRSRLRKAGIEKRADGTNASNPQRMGPLTFEARRMGLARVLEIQAEVNALAAAQGRPAIDILNPDEARRITELIDAGTWPDGWDGAEPRADVPLDKVFRNGAVQPLLFSPEDL